MDIYVKAAKKLDIIDRIVRLKDFADIVADERADIIGNIKILEINSKKKALFLITSADIVRAIKDLCPSASVFAIGERDTIICFNPNNPKTSGIMRLVKIAFVSAILLFGSATAVMSFFSDAEIARVFENVHRIIYGTENDMPLILEVPFSVGIASGIIVFFNHFAGLKLTGDPTPIEVEMALYDDDISKTMIDTLSSESEGSKDA